jgi:hypothetical protein
MSQTPEERKIAQREAGRKWQNAHREKCREYNRKWRKANPEKVKASKLKDWECHHEGIKARNRKYREDNLEDRRAAARAWHKAHPDRVRAARYKKKYGLTANEASQLVIDQQNGVCAACGGNRSKHALCVDHNHTTEKIRGLLCKKCNLALGHMEENSEWLQNLADYIKSFEV